MKTNNCNGNCADRLLERPRYFPRQLMTPDELTLEQQFFLDKMRRHNRLLHGWGVVCGAQVRQKMDKDGDPVPWTLEISAGSILDQVGNEIVIPKKIIYHLQKESVSGHYKNGDDPWCSDVPIDRPVGKTWYLAVCYEECERRPVRVMPAGCGCDDTDCENSRIRESFRIAALDYLPPSYEGLEFTPEPQQFNPWACNDSCPSCPEDPCVVLAAITADNEGNLEIDCYAYRRFAVSFACYPVFCAPDQGKYDQRAADVVKERLYMHLDESGLRSLDDDYDRALGAAVILPLTAIRGLGTTTDVGKALNEVKIGEAVGLTYEEFREKTKEWLKSVAPGERQNFIERQSRLIFRRAQEVGRLTRDFRTT